jgi:hypothetical protein
LEELNLKYKGKTPVTHAYRARIPGGWLIFIYTQAVGLSGVTFYPDPIHAWDGGTQEAGAEPLREK